jgi:hypothetical protein
MRYVLPLALATTLAVVGAALRIDPADPQVANACSIAPTTIESASDHATLIVLADVVEVGGAANEQPPLPSATPTNTYAPPPTLTPEVSPTRTPRGTSSGTPTTTPSPHPTHTPMPPPDLTGMRATLSVISSYDGDAPSTLTVDAAQRAAYERELRVREAQFPPTSICGPIPPNLYAVGQRYLVFVHVSDAATGSVMAIPVTNGRVSGNFSLRGETYNRYFRGLPVEFTDEGAWAILRAETIPLATYVRAVLGRRGATIAPPNTGTAGLR